MQNFEALIGKLALQTVIRNESELVNQTLDLLKENGALVPKCGRFRSSIVEYKHEFFGLISYDNLTVFEKCNRSDILKLGVEIDKLA